MTIHKLLLEYYHALDHIKLGGICHGFSVRYIEACLTDQELLFDGRIKKIQDYKTKGLHIKLMADQAKQKFKEKKNAEQQDKDAIDIAAFFDSIALFHNSSGHGEMLTTKPNQNSIEELSNFASSAVCASNGGLNHVDTQAIMYTSEELTTYLSELGNIIDSIEPSKEANFGFVIRGYGHDHTVALIYNKFTGWRFMDINSYPPVQLTKQQTPTLSSLLDKALNFTPSAYIKAGISIFTVGLAPALLTKLNEKLASFKERYIEEIIDKDIINRIENGISMAYIAVAYRNTKLLMLLAKHANKKHLDAVTFLGNTPLHFAAIYGHAPNVAILARYKVNLNRLVNGATAAIAAAVYGHKAVIQILGQYGADLNLPDANGFPPLYHAFRNGHYDTADMLIAYGANPNPKLPRGITLLSDAIERGDTYAARKLLNQGVNPSQVNAAGTPLVCIASEREDTASINLLAQFKANFSQTTKNGNTALHIAAKKGFVSVIKALAGTGDVNQKNSAGATAAYIACTHNQLQAIRELIQQKADFNIAFNSFTPLHIAAKKGFTAVIINIALNNKVDLNAVTTEGFTPLFLAAGADQMDAVSMLVEYGAKFNTECQILPDDLIEHVSTSGIDVKTRMAQFINNQIALKKNKVTIKASDIAQIMGHNKLADFLNNKNKKVEATAPKLISQSAISPRGRMQVSIFHVEPNAKTRTVLGALRSSDSLQNQLNSKCNL